MSENLKKLREPFPASQINKLPKPSKKQTEELKADYRKGQRCQVCGGWHQPEVVHLDYVGHASLTNRLLDTDPTWTWEPLAMNPNGLPVMDELGGMWIKLTVCGVTRLGYGHAGDKTGGDAIKEVIGDALRNAAMRFGAALDLWHKGDEPLFDEHVRSETGRILPTQASGAAIKEAAFLNLQPEIQDLLRKAIPRIVLFVGHKDIEGGLKVIQEVVDNLPEQDPNEIKMGLWHLLDSKTRTALKNG